MKKLLILLSAVSIAYGFDEEFKETIRKTFPSAARIDVVPNGVEDEFFETTPAPKSASSSRRAVR